MTDHGGARWLALVLAAFALPTLAACAPVQQATPVPPAHTAGETRPSSPTTADVAAGFAEWRTRMQLLDGELPYAPSKVQIGEAVAVYHVVSTPQPGHSFASALATAPYDYVYPLLARGKVVAEFDLSASSGWKLLRARESATTFSADFVHARTLLRQRLGQSAKVVVAASWYFVAVTDSGGGGIVFFSDSLGAGNAAGVAAPEAGVHSHLFRVLQGPVAYQAWAAADGSP